MNIIVLGNGYDLAHELPTRYVDFLHFIKAIQYPEIKNGKLQDTSYIKEHFKKEEIANNIIKHLENPEDEISKKINELIKANFWISHFNKNEIKKKENWIDFENEISNVIQFIDKEIKNQPGASIYSNIKYTKSFLDMIFPGECETYIKLKNKLLKDLNNFIRCFEIYLAEFVEKIPINPIFNIQRVCNNSEKIKVISFNYTHTFQKFYNPVVVDCNLNKKNAQIDYHYIHGEAKIENNVENNNMVLGIDEYLEGEAKNKETDFIAFKKYYQRIFKKTGSKYKKWLNSDSIDISIIGHSLNETDKDVLKELILRDNSKTTIYYYNSDDLGEKIANLVKVIGQEELIKRTGEDNIIFKDQKEIFYT